MIDDDRTLARGTVERAVRAVDPAWTVRSTDPIATGTAAVARVTVGTPTGRRDCVLKASPDGDRHGIDTEARVLALLADRTAVPVAEPLGAVDDDPALPTPLLLMTALPGESVARTDLDGLDGTIARRVARAMGRHLAAVHRVDAVDAFGYLEPADRGLAGGRPPADPAALRVRDPETEWRAAMGAFADAAVDGLRESRLADLAPAVEAALRDRIDRLAGPFEPVLAHVDGLLENVRIDPATGEVLGLLDWGFTLAATPGYDLAHVGRGLGGGPWTLPDPPDWAGPAREALVEGYADVAPDRAARYRRNRDCYELLQLARAGAHLPEWLALQGLDDGDRLAESERALRRQIAGLVD